MEKTKEPKLTIEEGIELYNELSEGVPLQKGENVWIDKYYSLSSKGIFYKNFYDDEGNLIKIKKCRPKKHNYRISVSITKSEHIEMKRLAKLRGKTLSKLLKIAFYDYFKH